MKHRATADFWERYHDLPEPVRKLADKNFALLRDNPRHPSLQFKKIGELWSARVGLGHRVLAIEESGGFSWVWIGSHAEYDRLLR